MLIIKTYSDESNMKQLIKTQVVNYDLFIKTDNLLTICHRRLLKICSCANSFQYT